MNNHSIGIVYTTFKNPYLNGNFWSNYHLFIT